MQKAVEERWPGLERPLLACLPDAQSLEWLSPLREDDFAEYRDGSFLRRLRLERLESELKAFWPTKGPQWDALARADTGQIVLVEAKAHIAEFCSPGSQASELSLAKIRRALAWLGDRLGSRERDVARWHETFYQYTNRLAHLAWLRHHGVDAWLALVGFVDDHEMPGFTTPEAWKAAYAVAEAALGIPAQHGLSKFVIHIYPSVKGGA
ncbi:MAG: hypothetical protein ACEQR8_08720 [Cypionkella sp.]